MSEQPTVFVETVEVPTLYMAPYTLSLDEAVWENDRDVAYGQPVDGFDLDRIEGYWRRVRTMINYAEDHAFLYGDDGR